MNALHRFMSCVWFCDLAPEDSNNYKLQFSVARGKLLMFHRIIKLREEYVFFPRVGNLYDNCGYKGKQNKRIEMHEGVHEDLLITYEKSP